MRFPGQADAVLGLQKKLDPLGFKTSGLVGFGDDKKAAPAVIPPIPEPAVAPVPDDRAIKVAKRRKFAQVRQRSGRLSTINTEPTLSTALG